MPLCSHDFFTQHSKTTKYVRITIKHQRDKQIIFVYLAGIKLPAQKITF